MRRRLTERRKRHQKRRETYGKHLVSRNSAEVGGKKARRRWNQDRIGEETCQKGRIWDGKKDVISIESEMREGDDIYNVDIGKK